MLVLRERLFETLGLLGDRLWLPRAPRCVVLRGLDAARRPLGERAAGEERR
eukprot:NODE_24834_length_609_cov_1.093361.p5 GENE.NODE_24834_length_609_cov_1.093361~~NODE_24834_length_609_cov_1.093361.p5  ORF type:complete len:51 (-),score=11.16 NODE_24834_length_609_cov_1.093361:386-538(-)